MNLAAAAVASDAARQHYLFEARQLQALSFAVHIPLVCFGIAFPALVVFCEWLGRRTGDEIYLTIARRWSKVMAALFAAGVVTGTILSFELGILWPEFMARFGAVFGLAFTLEGFSFFVEAIFIGIYIYGWDRMSPRSPPARRRADHRRRHRRLADGDHGQRVDEPSGRVPHRRTDASSTSTRGRRSSTTATFWHELVHMYLAGYMVVGFSCRGGLRLGLAAGRGRGATSASPSRSRLPPPCSRRRSRSSWATGRDATSPAYQPTKLAAFEGLGQTTKGAPVHLLGWYTDGHVRFGIKVPDLLSLLAFHDPNATVTGLDTVPAADRPPVNVVRIAFQTMVGIGTLLAALSLVVLWTWWRRRRLPASRWFYGAVVLAGPLSLVALIAGWVTTEVGRQPWIVYRVMRTEQAVTGASGIPVGYGALAAVYVGLAVAVWWVLRRLAAPRSRGGARA